MKCYTKCFRNPTGKKCVTKETKCRNRTLIKIDSMTLYSNSAEKPENYNTTGDFTSDTLNKMRALAVQWKAEDDDLWATWFSFFDMEFGVDWLIVPEDFDMRFFPPMLEVGKRKFKRSKWVDGKIIFLRSRTILRGSNLDYGQPHIGVIDIAQLEEALISEGIKMSPLGPRII